MAMLSNYVLLTSKENLSNTEEPAVIIPVYVLDSLPAYEPEAVANPWKDGELDAIAFTLAGECYDQMVEDKRRVCEVILNYVSDGRFGNSVIEVLTAKKISLMVTGNKAVQYLRMTAR